MSAPTLRPDPLALRPALRRTQRAARHEQRWLAALFFCSGMPALVYQLAWQRALFRVFGVNIESVTIVVAAFMLGLGLGSLAGAWLAGRLQREVLPWLAAIEALTAACGLASLPVFDAAGGWVLGSSLPVIAAAALGLVALPTLLMGATLPLLVGHLVRRDACVGEALGTLYHVNTLGAGAACLLCAALLFPALGLQASVHVAAVINAAIALGALVAHLYAGPATPSRTTGAEHTATSMRSTPPALRWPTVLGLSATSGLLSLAYEIFFARTVSYLTGSSAHAFALMLAAYLFGLAAGARVAGDASQRDAPDALLRRMARSVLWATAAGGAFLPAVSRLAWLDGALLGVALALVYLLARQWGIVLPALAQLGIAADGQAGRRTGLLYLANIVGATAGSVLTGFVLLEHFGLVALAQLLTAAGAATALWLGGLGGMRHGRLAGCAAAAALVALLLPAAAGRVHEALLFKGDAALTQPLRNVVENRSGIIAVDATGTVYGNGVYDGHFSVDLVHDVNGIVRPFALPLFHPAPREVLMIGLASGSWAQVIANLDDVASLTIVEINDGYARLLADEPAVASLLQHPKVRRITDDGRRWLRLHPERRFDAIVMNTTFFHRAHASNLLSADFLGMLKPHLRAGGIVFYNTTLSQRVQRTGCLAFAHGARFTNHMLLSDAPIDWDFERWRRALLGWRIDGRAVIEPSRPDDAAALARLMDLQPQARAAAGGEWIEPCAAVLARTAGHVPVTDDNMGSEWRSLWKTE